MKLIIQIPCLNEEGSLPDTLAALPREVEGFDQVEWLVIDDGSVDGTAEVARRSGANHVVRHRGNRGLAAAFSTGIETSLRLGADVIVNTDADNQYDGSSIPDLVAPILAGEADLVVGDRGVSEVDEFSRAKKTFQRLGSGMVRKISGVDVVDATSGFRAYTRETALTLVITTPFTYTLESLVQAGKARLALANVPVRRNDSVRPSRLFTSNVSYVRRNAISLVRIAAYYSPLRLFWSLAAVLAVLALLSWVPFLLDLGKAGGAGHTQSVVLGAVFALAAVMVFSLGVLADQIASLRYISTLGLRNSREAVILADRDSVLTSWMRTDLDSIHHE